jgi:hypothetical protein
MQDFDNIKVGDMTDIEVNLDRITLSRLSPESVSLLRLRALFLLAFLTAFFYSAAIVVFLLFLPLLLTGVPVWANWGIITSAVLFGITSIRQCISLYRLEQSALYYFLVLEAIVMVLFGVIVWITAFHKASLFFAGIAIAVVIVQYALIQAVHKMTRS